MRAYVGRRPRGVLPPRSAAAFAVLIGLALTLSLAAPPTSLAAIAPSSPGRVPMLILDGGLGDAQYYLSHWLGNPERIASQGYFTLWTSAAPVWWGGPGAPDTYLLTSSDGSGSVAAAPLGTPEICWALDQLAERHPDGRAVCVGEGVSGLSARRYLEDQGTPKQSERADVVGLVMLGTPSRGITFLPRYPELDVWQPYAAAGGLFPVDLSPGSAALRALDGGRLPAVVKTLVVEGYVTEIAGLPSDGISGRGDSALATGVSQGPIDYVSVPARASTAWSLRDTWFKVSKQAGDRADAVANGDIDKLGPVAGYSFSAETKTALRKYYQAWFSGEVPTTHISSRLVVDVSGSMAEAFGAGTKLDAAKKAADDFTDALDARRGSPGAVPEDIGLMVFNESVSDVAAPGSSVARVRKGLRGLKARGNTDVGKAIARAVGSFGGAPPSAEKVVVFLSDGVNTAGLDEKGVLSGPVKLAKQRGIRIEVIALGGVGSSDVSFLRRIASVTGGSFHQARDLFELRRDFLRARYSSLGTVTVDTETKIAPGLAIDLATATVGVRRIEAGVVTDGGASSWELLRDGKKVAAGEFALSTTSDGVTSIVVADPKPGGYSLRLVDAKGATRAHVFAVTQVDAFRPTGTSAPPDTSAELLLIILGAGAAVAVIITVSLSLVHRRGGRTEEAAPSEEMLDEWTLEGGE